jgi:hypothetical protein
MELPSTEYMPGGRNAKKRSAVARPSCHASFPVADEFNLAGEFTASEANMPHGCSF